MNSINTKNKKHTPTIISVCLTGIFWIVSGVFLVINNFYPLSNNIKLIVLFGGSVYLLLLSMLLVIQKRYFIIGLITISLGINLLLEQYIDNNQLLWPILMAIMGLGVIVYGVFFKKSDIIKYVVPGAILLGMSCVAWLSIKRVFSLSDIIIRLWPVLLVLLGIHRIYSFFKKLKARSTVGSVEKPDSQDDIEK